MENFAELSINPRLKKNLTEAGFTVMTPVQAGAIPPALAGKDVLATAQTGTGKTFAFAIPILEHILLSKKAGVLALVVVPTRELAMQVYEAFHQVGVGTGIRAALVIGGLSEHNQLSAIRQRAQLVIATPGRLDDFIKRREVNLSSVQTLILDEADRMVDMGFLPQMKSILEAVPAKRQTMCFSATLAGEVAHLVRQYLQDPVRVEIGSTHRHAESVKLQVYEVTREQKIELLIKILETEPGTFLIFTRTKYGADKLARHLVRSGQDAAVIHGNRSQNQRIAALKGFQQGKFRILVATDIASRGIHVDSISHVINFDLPEVPEDFIHRVGRTGRAEDTGIASTFVTAQDRGEIARIERMLGSHIQRMPMPAGFSPQAPQPHHWQEKGADPLEALRPRGYGGRSPQSRKSGGGGNYRHGRGDGPHGRGRSFRRGRQSHSRGYF